MSLSLRAGDWVEVRSAGEILATLDGAGELAAMPFMAEMLAFCGRRLRVAALAHKTCDTIHRTGGRKLEDCVHLEGARCDGGAHGGCQAACLIFWKTAWLKKVDGGPPAAAVPAGPPPQSEHTVLQAKGFHRDEQGLVYSCQATRLYAATQPLPWWHLGQYFTDLRSGNVSLKRFFRVLMMRILFHLRRLPFGYRLTVGAHDCVHRLVMGRETPFQDGLLPAGQPTPTGELGVKPGDWVQIKPLAEIRHTLNVNNVNRGMRFDPEMAQFCGGRFRVAGRVERLIDERTGRMLNMKSPCITLEGVVCSADYSERRLFCPRAIPPYFREIWLQRAPGGPS